VKLAPLVHQRLRSRRQPAVEWSSGCDLDTRLVLAVARVEVRRRVVVEGRRDHDPIERQDGRHDKPEDPECHNVTSRSAEPSSAPTSSQTTANRKAVRSELPGDDLEATAPVQAVYVKVAIEREDPFEAALLRERHERRVG